MEYTMDQGSAEWFAIRCGKVTASRMADVIATTKKGWGAARGKYLGQIVAERITGVVQDHRNVWTMVERLAMEPEARDAYAFYADVEVLPIGFVQHDRIPMAGASPDGHIGLNGSLEIKCLNSDNHINLMLGDETIWEDYEPQIQFQLACSGREWCDFVSYDPRMPEDLKVFVKRIPRDPARISLLEQAAIAFIDEVDAKVEKLRALELRLPEAA